MTLRYGDGLEMTLSEGSAIPDSGVSRWTFDDVDTNSGTAVDSWDGYDGTINGATTGVAGISQTYNSGQAYDFDGVDDSVNFGNIALTEPTVFTVTGWVVSNDTSSFGPILGVRGNGTDTWSVQDAVGDLLFRINEGSSTTTIGSTSITQGEAYFFAGRWDSSTGDGEFFVDGSSVGTGNSAMGSSSGDLKAGADNGGNNANAVIDDLRFYDKLLSDTEISNLYNTGHI